MPTKGNNSTYQSQGGVKKHPTPDVADGNLDIFPLGATSKNWKEWKIMFIIIIS